MMNLLTRNLSAIRSVRPFHVIRQFSLDATKDFYGILGVSKTDTVTRIGKAYDELLRFESSQEKLKDIQRAYDTLSDPAKRKWYDAGFIVNASTLPVNITKPVVDVKKVELKAAKLEQEREYYSDLTKNDYNSLRISLFYGGVFLIYYIAVVSTTTDEDWRE